MWDWILDSYEDIGFWLYICPILVNIINFKKIMFMENMHTQGILRVVHNYIKAGIFLMS